MGKASCDSHIVTNCDIGHITQMSHVTVTTCDEVDT